MDTNVRLYLSSRFIILGIIITSGPLAFFSYWSVKTYSEKLSVSIAFGIGAVLFLFAFFYILRSVYFIILHRPALILDKQSLTDNLSNTSLKWSEISGIEFRAKGGRVVGREIVVTSDISGTTIKIGYSLIEEGNSKPMKDLEVFGLLKKYKDKYCLS